MKYRYYLLLILFAMGTITAFGQDPFVPYLDGKAPVVVKKMGSEVTPEGIRIERLVFKSRVVQTAQGPQTSLVFAAVVHPPGKGPHPGLLRLHGGGGNADIPSAVESARAGYVSMVLDIPGIAGKGRNPENTINWKGIPMIGAKPDPSYSALFDAVLASAQSFYLLRSQSDVDAKKIAIAGASWGGYTATMLATLLNKDIVCTYSVYGSGNFMEGAYEKQHIEKLPAAEREAFIRYLDPGSRARAITKPYMIASASNDRHWSWMAVQKLLKQVRGPVYTFYSPNDNHMMKFPGNGLMMPFLNHFLKGTADLPKIDIRQVRKLENGDLAVTYHIKSGNRLLNSRIYFTNPSIEPVWTERKWLPAEGQAFGKMYRAIIPANIAKNSTDWYVVATVEWKGNKEDAVSVSSLIQQSQ